MMVRIGSNPIALELNLFELLVKRAVDRLESCIAIWEFYMALLISDPLRCGDKDDGVTGRLMAHTSKRSAGRVLTAAVVLCLL